MADKKKDSKDNKSSPKLDKFQQDPRVNIEDIGQFLEDIRKKAIDTSDWPMLHEWMKLYKDYVQLAITVRKVKEQKDEKAADKEQQVKEKENSKNKKLI